MQFFASTKKILVGLLAVGSSAQRFSLSCKPDKYAIGDNKLLYSECRYKGHWRPSILNMDLCFGNRDGGLERVDDGDYSETCKDCIPELITDKDRPDSLKGPSLPIMNCKCKNKQGAFVDASINLDNYLSNWEGIVCCSPYCGIEPENNDDIEDDPDSVTPGIPGDNTNWIPAPGVQPPSDAEQTEIDAAVDAAAATSVVGQVATTYTAKIEPTETPGRRKVGPV